MALTATVPKHRLVLVEDQTAIRQILARLLGSLEDFTIVGEANTPAAAIALLVSTAPDIVLLDWTLASGCGNEVLAAIRRHPRPPKVLVFSGSTSYPVIREALATGALGFIEKTAQMDELFTGLRAVAAGCQYLGPAAAEIIRHEADIGGTDTPFAALTNREQEILRHVADGLGSKQIAAAIGVSPRTVENHRANIGRKTGLNSVAQLTRHAMQMGLV